MAVERTLCIVKPDAVEKHKAGAILAHIEEGGFKVVALRMAHLTRPEAEERLAQASGSLSKALRTNS